MILFFVNYIFILDNKNLRQSVLKVHGRLVESIAGEHLVEWQISKKRTD